MRLTRWIASLFRPNVRLSAAGPLDALISAALQSAGGAAPVSRAEALSVPAVLKARNMLCSIATLPLEQRAPDNTLVPNPLLGQIDTDVANVVTMAMTVEDLIFEGVAWWKITGRGFDRFPTSAMRIDPDSVSLTPPATGGTPALLPSGIDPHAASVWIDGVETSSQDVIRFDSPNPAVRVHAARAIRRALLLDKAAAMYSDDPRPLDYFSPAEGADPISDGDARHIISAWRAARKQRATGWVPAAMTYHSVDSPSPAELQLVELQRQASLDIANELGVDPEDLGVSTTSRTYANAVDRRRDRINDVLAPYMRAITDRLSMGDVTRRGYLVAFNLNDYLKSNPTERAAVQKAYLDMHVYDVADIQRQEGIPVTDNGDQADAPDPAEEAAVAAARRALRSVPTYATPTDAGGGGYLAAALAGKVTHRLVAELPLERLSVDLTKRTITGMVLPYGTWARTGGYELRFAPGALQFSDMGRIKLLRDHDPAAAIGYATAVKETRAGVMATFKVARGQAGDDALVLAEDGVLDGFSVGADIDMSADAVVDPKRKTAMLVNRADWRETSLTAVPAFDDARVTSVAASATGGAGPMECTLCGQTHAAGVACPTTTSTTPPAAAAPSSGTVTLTDAQFNALLARSAPMSQPTPVGAELPEGPTLVNANRPTATTAVREPAPYRFDRKGNLLPAAHEFSRDVFAGLREHNRDDAAYNRAMSWVRAQFDVVTTDVNELNPTRQRPELYVDQRSFKYPIWDAVNKGTLSDITPFAFPKFSSASGLVAAHVEGVEPSSGTFVTTSQTITPAAMSGKAKISRETWDQGGNPQIGNLIWQQMLKSWYEALEAAAVTVLDAASPTQIDFSGTPGLANDDLDQAITAAFASLQFVRGGFSMDNMFTQIDLYKALVAATDASGRRLYPAIGPTNAMGTAGNRFGSLDLNGVTALPAWALAATGTVAASSYLFDSFAVHGWASAPQRLTIDMTEVANVYIGLWGYHAEAISDINGVREIVYDPA